MSFRPAVKLDPVQQQYQRKYWQVRIVILLILLILLLLLWFLELFPSGM